MGGVMPRATLEQNIAAYERMQDQLQAEHMGQWVVVDNEQLIDAFDDFQDAADLVIEKIGPGCLLRQVGRPPARLPASVLCQRGQVPVASCGFTGLPGRLIDTGPELQVELTNPWALDARPRVCKALIDTGANHCFVSGRVADDLRLERFATEDFRGAAGRFASPRYLVYLRIPQLATRASILLARRLPAAGCRLPAAGCRMPDAGCRMPTRLVDRSYSGETFFSSIAWSMTARQGTYRSKSAVDRSSHLRRAMGPLCAGHRQKHQASKPAVCVAGRAMPCIGHQFVGRSGRSPLTPTTQTWSLEPGASPASIQAKTGNFLARAASGCTTAEVMRKVGGLGGHAYAGSNGRVERPGPGHRARHGRCLGAGTDRPGPADPRPALRPAELVR